ncbi:Maf-like protein [Seminavis robusta]|uniref:Maf-like protein n=1 Tax=Seminavis robusta TaxID=568900 RepID=A0A9N8ESA5_9STRA|nr:Maf-like protein [Seminavis robusta]|eukprot:Sro1456_g274250.1 Maf-like protein (246) ;mRNA; f:15338-16075
MSTADTTIDTGSSDTTQEELPLVLSLSRHLGSTSSSSDVHLILASQSPRRKEILDMMGLQGKFTPTPSPLDESALQKQLASLPPVEYTRRLAEEKAKALAMDMTGGRIPKPTLVLGSDTIVDLEGTILEKPTDAASAKVMLQALSGQRHNVHTGVALYLVQNQEEPKLVASITDTAGVLFAHLREHDIDAYIQTGEPMDKAGSYGIQGIGGQFVANVSGDFFTVMGLPMHKTSQMLAKAIKDVLQ